MAYTPLCCGDKISFSAPYIHPACILHGSYMHPTCTLHAPYTHPTCTLHAPYTHPTRTLHAPYMHPTRTLHAPYMHPAGEISDSTPSVPVIGRRMIESVMGRTRSRLPTVSIDTCIQHAHPTCIRRLAWSVETLSPSEANCDELNGIGSHGIELVCHLQDHLQV